MISRIMTACYSCSHKIITNRIIQASQKKIRGTRLGVWSYPCTKRGGVRLQGHGFRQRHKLERGHLIMRFGLSLDLDQFGVVCK